MKDRSQAKNDRVKLEEFRFLHRCGTLLLGLPPDKAIPRILGMLGRKHRADRAWMIRYNPEFTHFWNTHEWTRGDTRPHVADLQGIPVEMGAWLHETLLQDQNLMITDTGKMPRRARALQAEFQRQGIGSLLSVPIFHQGRMRFQIGYDAKSTNVRWTDQEAALLRQVGRLFALRLLACAESVWVGGTEEAPTTSSRVHLLDRSVHQRFDFDDITHITADGDYSQVHLQGAPSIHDTRSLRYWQSALSTRHFIRISRSAIINLHHLDQLTRRGGNWKLTLQGNTPPLSVGRNYRTDLLHKLG